MNYYKWPNTIALKFVNSSHIWSWSLFNKSVTMLSELLLSWEWLIPLSALSSFVCSALSTICSSNVTWFSWINNWCKNKLIFKLIIIYFRESLEVQITCRQVVSDLDDALKLFLFFGKFMKVCFKKKIREIC